MFLLNAIRCSQSFGQSLADLSKIVEIAIDMHNACAKIVLVREEEMTHEQRIALSHWSMYAIAGFPVVKMGRKWWVVVDETSLWRVVGGSCPTPFKTKTAAQDFWNNLVLQRSREWRSQ